MDSTTNLNLQKYNLSTELSVPFSIQDALNDNWDKLDIAVAGKMNKVTSVGSSTVPVYIDSSGNITSTGYSIANARFDGPYIEKFKLLSSSNVKKGNYFISRNTIGIPSSGNYLLYLWLGFFRESGDTNSNVTISLTSFNATTTSSGTAVFDSIISKHGFNYTSADGNHAEADHAETVIYLPNGTSGIYLNILNADTKYCALGLCGYRQVGTNGY